MIKNNEHTTEDHNICESTTDWDEQIKRRQREQGTNKRKERSIKVINKIKKEKERMKWSVSILTKLMMSQRWVPVEVRADLRTAESGAVEWSEKSGAVSWSWAKSKSKRVWSEFQEEEDWILRDRAKSEFTERRDQASRLGFSWWETRDHLSFLRIG